MNTLSWQQAFTLSMTADIFSKWNYTRIWKRRIRHLISHIPWCARKNSLATGSPPPEYVENMWANLSKRKIWKGQKKIKKGRKRRKQIISIYHVAPLVLLAVCSGVVGAPRNTPCSNPSSCLSVGNKVTMEARMKRKKKKIKTSIFQRIPLLTY